ncbi:MAG TPA: 50S ribosomal protein L18e [Thermoplasmatales archaeon]|nr:50S ribosomal protein L18e [Thermoplasmatales archaeon]
MKKTNPSLIHLIQELKKKAHENDAPIWRDIAERLERPLRNWTVVNIDKIERYVNEKEIALIPGKVLSSGSLTKKITVAAWAFSEKAKEKIQKAGGECISIEELIKRNPKGSNIRIIG